MYIADISKIYLCPNSLLRFEGNKADVHGGALRIESGDYLDTMYPYNPSCFLQYHLPRIPPSKWNVSFFFIIPKC